MQGAEEFTLKRIKGEKLFGRAGLTGQLTLPRYELKYKGQKYLLKPPQEQTTRCRMDKGTRYNQLNKARIFNRNQRLNNHRKCILNVTF